MHCYNGFMEQPNFKNIVENLDSVVIAVDNNNNIIYANKYFCSLFNTNCNKIYGKNIYEFLPQNKDTIVIKDYTYKISKHENIYYLSVIDNQMEKVYSDFISTVSHELRTPLTSIRGFADTMLMSFDKLDKAQIQKFLTIIKEQSNRLIKLVENLLSISKMQVEQTNLVYKSVNVKTQIEQVLYIIKNQYPEYNFEFDCATDISNILTDENKFQQIMINLLDNAAKYSFDKGTITVKAANKDENFVSIKVIDHGIGITPENFSKIFDKFARVENHLTRKVQGSGLGLYIVKNLIEKMGGQILVESCIELPDSGSVFEVILPCATYTNQCKKVMEDR